MENDKLISIGKAAKLLGISIQTLRRWDDKGILRSFRSTPEGKRFYSREEIRIFINDMPSIAWKWVTDLTPYEPIKDFYCPTSDVFSVRAGRLENCLRKVEGLGIDHSLLTSMVLEIGDNSFAHNLGNWPDVRGIFFAYDLNKRVIVLADRGRGILQTLKPVKPDLATHKEALELAFTKIISGRFPERRGNGLKSVARNVVASNVKLLYRTGDAQLDLQRGDEKLEKLRISECEDFHCCYAVLQF